jgi:hypothetical protein
VGGDVTAHVHNARDLRVEAGATVRGKTETRVREAKPGRSRYARPSFYLWKAIWLAAAFVTGLLLRLLVPAVFEQASPNASDILKSLGLGFLVLVAGPVAIVAVGLTLVGLPVALAALGLWLAGLYASSIIVAALVGRRLLEKPTAAAPSFAPALLVGLLTLTVASSLPFLVGALVRSLVLTAGLGLLARRLSGAVRTASG